MPILVTGAAGFIGFSLCKKLLDLDFEIIGLDNLNSYYDVNLKKARINQLENISHKKGINFILEVGNLQDKKFVDDLFDKYKPATVVNLAAQAGVRYSLKNPYEYIDTNVMGFLNILEGSKRNNIKHLLYASSSSVYGGNENIPFKESSGVDHPVSLYAASKKSNEMMAHVYSHLYSLPTTGLRFFTVYGPWGRPDMALFLFTKAIFAEKPIEIFNNGDMIRDFTYIDDITETLVRLLDKPPVMNNNFNRNNPDPSNSWAPYKLFNIGNSSPVSLMRYISALEDAIGKTAKKIFLPMQPGDVKTTSACTKSLEEYIDFKPQTSIQKGIDEFISWYKDFYSV
tara:strand:+ start:12 stop:1034 length:1023 start_codon:yes stop_codon:yes gene_type:complete